MTGALWWKIGIIYEIAVPSFADSDGDGMGDLRGIIERLDHLNDGTDTSLGVDAIWLTPVNASPMHDFGYDVSDYRSINPRFGDMSDFEELLGRCHERGIRVLMDLALNHTSVDHPWFREARRSRDSARRDWYVWRDGKSPGKRPNRWVSVVEGSAWAFDETTGQYYYHAFLPFQPDLNWRNADVRAEMLDIAQFWLAKGVDGFRLDLINFLYEDAEFRENPPCWGPRPYFWQRHVYDRSRPESLHAASELRNLSDGFAERVLMGEVCSDDPADTVEYLGDGGDRLHLAFYLDFATRRWSARGFRASVAWLESHVPPGAWPCYYLDNHDLERSYTRLGRRGVSAARAKVAAAMLLTLRGTPIIYYGQEIGMPQSHVPRSRFADPVGRRYWPLSRGRDGARTPMQWRAGHGAGFTSGDAWLPVDPSYRTSNVEAQHNDPGSLLEWYKRLIRVRRESPALRSGSYAVLEGVPHSVFAYVRASGDERIAVLLNFASRPVRFRLPAMLLPADGWTRLLSTHGGRTEPPDPGSITLAPNEALLLTSII